MRLLMAEPNVLLLDEPTNDLDIDTLTALEDLLDGWPGSLVVASHDRYLIERVCDTVYALLGDGRLSALPGGVEEYLARRQRTAAAAPAVPRPGASRPELSRSELSRPEARSDQPAGEPPAPAAARARAAKKELARLERQIGRLEQREATLHAELAAHATDYLRVGALDAELRAVRAEREAAETAWLELSETKP
jgi:ATP-binding cassette subfamily F protein uup